MRQFLTDGLHLFVIIAMVLFVAGGILGATGIFDHWAERYRLKRRRRRLLRAQHNKAPLVDDKPHPSANGTYIVYKGKYAA